MSALRPGGIAIELRKARGETARVLILILIVILLSSYCAA